MKISLCKNNKGRKKTQDFLERNLRKVKIEEKDCIHMCSDCKKKIVAIVDGKELTAKDDYELLKEIKKILKKTDKLDLLAEEIKTEIKVKADKAKADKDKSDKDKTDKKKAGKKRKSSKKAKAAHEDDQADEEVEDVASDDVFEVTYDEDQAAELIEDQAAELPEDSSEIKAQVKGDELILTLPNETYSLDNLKITVNFGSFGTSDSTYEVVRLEDGQTRQTEQGWEKQTEVDSSLRFSQPQLEIEKTKPDAETESGESEPGELEETDFKESSE